MSYVRTRWSYEWKRASRKSVESRLSVCRDSVQLPVQHGTRDGVAVSDRHEHSQPATQGETALPVASSAAGTAPRLPVSVVARAHDVRQTAEHLVDVVVVRSASRLPVRVC